MNRFSEGQPIDGLHVLIDSDVPPETVELIAKAGPEVIQLRDKKISNAEMITWGNNVMQLTEGSGINVIVNDRGKVAKAINAHGLHVGQDDMSALAARALFPDKIIGVSATTDIQAQEAELDGADYIGVGPIYDTTTKQDAVPPIGLESLAQIREHTSVPIVAIGGITHRSAFDVINRGADGIAVIGAVLRSERPGIATKSLKKVIFTAKSLQQ